MTIAALYLDPRGPYQNLLGAAACWDEKRDAKLYAGPDPVVAHPPCGPWSRLRHLYEGGGAECAPRALAQVRAFGGVLEHPAQSKLFDFCGIPKPGDPPDAFGGYTIAVNQCDWGHVARKPTWLYFVGVPRESLVFPPPGTPTHWASGSRGADGKNSSGTGNGVPPGIKVCSAQQRRRTPPAFALWLIDAAERARKHEALPPCECVGAGLAICRACYEAERATRR